MPNTVRLDHLDTESIELPHDVADKLRSEARKSRLSVPEFIMQWLEDHADAREAAAVMKRIKSGEENTAPAEEVWSRLGI